MFIIWGTKNDVKTDKTIGYSVCPNCGYNTEKALVKEKFKFTLFFIPIISVTKRRGICCPECGMYKELNASEYKEMLERQ